MLVTVASQQIKSATVLALELCLMALCMRVCMFICVAREGSNCLTPAALHIQNANPSPRPLRDPSLNPRLLSNDFYKSRSDLNDATNSEFE